MQPAAPSDERATARMRNGARRGEDGDGDEGATSERKEGKGRKMNQTDKKGDKDPRLDNTQPHQGEIKREGERHSIHMHASLHIGSSV